MRLKQGLPGAVVLMCTLLFVYELVLFSDGDSRRNTISIPHHKTSFRSHFRTLERPIDVVFCTDVRTVEGLLASMHSVVRNTKYPQMLRFFVVCTKGEKRLLKSAIACFVHLVRQNFLRDAIADYRVLEFDMHFYDPEWRIAYREPSWKSDRSSPANYARMYLPELLQNVKMTGYPQPQKVLYLDTDVIVNSDVSTLLRTSLEKNSYPVAMAHRDRNLREFEIDFDHPILSEWNRKYNGTELEILPTWTAYNNGVMVVNLSRWRSYNITGQTRFWVKANLQRKLYNLSFNPPHLLALRNRVERLSKEWNWSNLGVRRYPAEIVRIGKILHWTGVHKPWKETGLHSEFWRPYAVQTCNVVP